MAKPRHQWTSAKIDRTIDVYLLHVEGHPGRSVPKEAVAALSVELGLEVEKVRAAVDAVESIDASTLRTVPCPSDELRERWIQRNRLAKPPGAFLDLSLDLPAAGDPTDEPFVDAVERALEALSVLTGPSDTETRARLLVEKGLPRHVFGWLAKQKAIVPAPGRGKRRVLSDRGRTWLADPDQIPTPTKGGVPGWKRKTREALAAFAKDESLPISKTRPYVLADGSKWKLNLWEPQRNQLGRAIQLDAADLHRWAHHLQSSQAFALNLFGPLAIAATGDPAWAWAHEVWAPWFTKVTHVEFEAPRGKDADPLHETSENRPHRTRVDVQVRHGDGQTTLIEVKFTEPEFGPCSAGHDISNRATCTKPWTMAAAAACPLVVNHGRRYFQLLPHSLVSLDTLHAEGRRQCPLREGNYQLVRNLLVASKLKEAGGRVGFAVVAPGPRLNPRLHASVADGAGKSIAGVLSALTKGKAIETRFLAFEDLLASPAPVAATAWKSYMERKYLRALEAAVA